MLCHSGPHKEPISVDLHGESTTTVASTEALWKAPGTVWLIDLAQAQVRDLTKFMERQNKIQAILDSRPKPRNGPGGRPRIVGLHQQLRIVLHLPRHNVRQAFIADQYDISQPTVSRIYRTLMPLISMALALEASDLKEALARGEPLVIDDTDVRVRKHRLAIETHDSGKKMWHRSISKSSPRWPDGPFMSVNQCPGGCTTG